jgi:uncharacterized glyoxalase superfamily protein PhnB
MDQTTRAGRPNIFPALRYRDAPAAIAWLGAACGFAERLVVPGPDGTIGHAELGLGPGTVMLGTAGDDELGPDAPRDSGAASVGLYVYVDDVDAHHARAVAAGAEVARALEDTDYGSREYTVRDPEGHLWSFGTYRPGAAPAETQPPDA